MCGRSVADTEKQLSAAVSHPSLWGLSHTKKGAKVCLTNGSKGFWKCLRFLDEVERFSGTDDFFMLRAANSKMAAALPLREE